MIIPIEREDGGTKDWVMIELQGDLKHSTGDACKSRFIGDLHFAQDGTPILIIGVHVLYGKETNLAKPLALLEKIEGKGSDDATVGDSSVSEKSSRYVVKAIVKKKLIFKGRPKPIVTDVPICI